MQWYSDILSVILNTHTNKPTHRHKTSKQTHSLSLSLSLSLIQLVSQRELYLPLPSFSHCTLSLFLSLSTWSSWIHWWGLQLWLFCDIWRTHPGPRLYQDELHINDPPERWKRVWGATQDKLTQIQRERERERRRDFFPRGIPPPRETEVSVDCCFW